MCRVVSGPAIRQRRVTYRMGKEPLARRWLWVYAREIAYLVPVAVRFGNDLPQTLDEPARCHSEVHKNLLPGGPPYGAHLLAKSMRSSASLSGCIRLRLTSIQVA